MLYKLQKVISKCLNQSFRYDLLLYLFSLQPSCIFSHRSMCVCLCVVTMPPFLSFLINVRCRLPSLSKPSVCVCVFVRAVFGLIFVLNVNHQNLIQPGIDLVSATLSSTWLT